MGGMPRQRVNNDSLQWVPITHWYVWVRTGGLCLYNLIQGSKITGKELKVHLELVDSIPLEERKSENVANEGSEEEEKSGTGRGDPSHGTTKLLRVETSAALTYSKSFICTSGTPHIISLLRGCPRPCTSNPI